LAKLTLTITIRHIANIDQQSHPLTAQYVYRGLH